MQKMNTRPNNFKYIKLYSHQAIKLRMGITKTLIYLKTSKKQPNNEILGKMIQFIDIFSI